MFAIVTVCAPGTMWSWQTSKGFKFTKNILKAEIKWDDETMHKWLENPKQVRAEPRWKHELVMGLNAWTTAAHERRLLCTSDATTLASHLSDG